MFSDTVVLRICSQCGATETIPNREGFLVCRNCGCIQESDNFGQPSYNALTNQSTSYGHAVRNKHSRTQIGTKLERAYTKFRALETQQVRASNKYESRVELEAKHEVTRICYNLSLPESFRKDVMKIFGSVFNKTKVHSQQRNIQTFVPIVIYRCAQLFGYSLPIKQLLPELRVEPKKFRNVLIATYHLFGRVNHYKNIVKVIREICTKLATPAQVFLTAMKIFSRERRELMLSAPNVAACSAVGLAIIALKHRRAYPLMIICKHGDCSQAAMTSRMFSLAKKRKLKIRLYKIHELDTQLPKYYQKLIESTENFASPVMRESVKNIHRIANELDMPYAVKRRAIKLLRSNKHNFLMTTKEVCASSAVGLAVLTLGMKKRYPMYRIGKVMGCSASSISSRIFKVLKTRGMEGSYKIYYWNEVLPNCYERLLGKK